MYESPINVICGEMQMRFEDEILEAVKNVGVYVDKDELVKSLSYDRNQYSKGYNDAVEEFREYLKTVIPYEMPTVIPYEMPQDIRIMGVDNICDRMLKK